MPKHSSGAALRYCGRPFTQEEIELIRRLISAEPRPNRAQLSRRVCEALRWVNLGGGERWTGVAVCVAVLRRGQFDETVFFHAQHRNAAGHVFERCAGAHPAQRLADCIIRARPLCESGEVRPVKTV